MGILDDAGNRLLKLYDGWSGERAHPNSPAGSGGPGHFRIPGVLNFDAGAFFGIAHHDSPSGRIASHENVEAELKKRLIVQVAPDVLRPNLVSSYTRNL